MKSDNRPPTPPPPPDPPSNQARDAENPSGQPGAPENQGQTENPGPQATPTPEPIKGADISAILAAWTYNPEQINARRILADDGEERIQVRLDLGILQMHTTGRPDGARPMGYESLLEYYESQLDDAEHERDGPSGREGRRELRPDDPRSRDPRPERPTSEPPEDLSQGGDKAEDDESDDDAKPQGPRPAGGGSDNPSDASGDASADASSETKPGEFKLSSDDCQSLREEAVQYYHRYVAMMALEDFYGVIRDTTRNLRVLDLCRDHAAEESDQEFLEQFRPYILMVRARALASQAISNNEPKAALHAIDEALDALKQHFDLADEPNAFDMSGEVQMLRSMRDSLVPKLPISPMAELRARLAKAIESENYELAAILRDELKQMKD